MTKCVMFFLMLVASSSAFLATTSLGNRISVRPTSYTISPCMQRARPVASGLRMDSGGSTGRVDFLRQGT